MRRDALRGGLINLWLYKENKLRDWKMYLLYIFPLNSTHSWLRCSNFFNPSKNCAANRIRGNRKSQRLISIPTCSSVGSWQRVLHGSTCYSIVQTIFVLRRVQKWNYILFSVHVRTVKHTKFVPAQIITSGSTDSTYVTWSVAPDVFVMNVTGSQIILKVKVRYK
jgi:hypothetical protein